MARWRLIEPHYLKVKGITWEYQETDRATGRQVRKSFPVPQYFHPDTEVDWTERNGRDMGWVVVTDGKNAKPTDIVFEGEPTPGMEALDDEAKAISARYSDKWQQPNREFSIEERGYADRMMDKFIQEQGKVNLVLAESREAPGMGDFMKAMTDMMQQNQKIMMMLAEKSAEQDSIDKFKKRA